MQHAWAYRATLSVKVICIISEYPWCSFYFKVSHYNEGITHGVKSLPCSAARCLAHTT